MCKGHLQKSFSEVTDTAVGRLGLFGWDIYCLSGLCFPILHHILLPGHSWIPLRTLDRNSFTFYVPV